MSLNFISVILLKAVCCSDGKHCCPQGATCDLSSGKCNTGDFQTDWVAKEPSRPLEVTVVQQSVLVVKEPTRNTEDRVEQTDLDSKLRNVPCGGGYYCPDFTRCCPSPTAVWSCCPTNYVIVLFNKPYAYSECACAKSITLSQVKGQPV